MNLSILEKMVREGDVSSDALRYFLDCRSECEWLDFKEDLYIENDKELCDFGRDSLAFKNVGGGFIVAGVKDKTWEPIGLNNKIPYDTKMLRDKLRKCLGLELEVDIVHHELLIQDQKKLFAIVYIRASRKRSRRRTPTLVKIDYCASKPFGVRRGEIYARRGDSTVRVASQADIEDLIDRLEDIADQDEIKSSQSSSPFAINTGLYRLLEKGFTHFVGRHELRNKLMNSIIKDPRLWIINVHGPGGVGKSALVNWVTYELYRDNLFESIIHLTGKETILTEKGIRPFSRNLYSLDNLLDHILSVFEEEIPDELDFKKKMVIEIFTAYKTLLVLDNMETVSDARILNFIQDFPVESKAKVVLTSRHKTGGWELPIPVSEFSREEVKEYIALTASELDISFPIDEHILERVEIVSGKLPLAIKWLLAQYKLTKDLKKVLLSVSEKDSPVLEFSFRNMWTSLSQEARTLLAIITIFDAPPTKQLIQIASELNTDILERALMDLGEVTLVNPFTNSDGSVVYVALPITLSFARHQLSEMGEFELRSRKRLNQYTQQMSLQESEIRKFKSDFVRYGIETNNERRAVIFCKQAESDAFAGRSENAENVFKRATDLAPQSAYVHAMRASFELTQGRIGVALECIEEACKRCNKKTGGLCYTIKAQILDAQWNKTGRVEALKKALEFDTNDLILQHQYGVSLSRAGYTKQAIDVFTSIINIELGSKMATPTLIMALQTRALNYSRLGLNEEMKTDIKQAQEVISKNPRLKHMEEKLLEI